MWPDRRPVGEEESLRANRADWDAYADEYQATHGEFLGDAGFLWGPEGTREDDLGALGDVAGRDVLEIGCGAGQCSRWVLAHGGRPVGIDVSMRQLQHSRRIDDEHRVGVPTVCASAASLPFAAASYDVVFSAFGALQFVADADGLVAGVARVLRPGGVFAFSITHPTRWMFPDDPSAAGLTATQSYWDRTPYVEVDDADRRHPLRRAPPHPRRLGGRARRARVHPHRPARAGVARGPRPHVGRLEPGARPADPGIGDLRRDRRLTSLRGVRRSGRLRHPWPGPAAGARRRTPPPAGAARGPG